MIDVIWNNCATSSHFITDKFRGNDFWRIGTKAFAFVLAHIGQFMLLLRFANGDIFHLRSDDAAACIVHLCDVTSFAIDIFSTAWFINMSKS